MRILSICFIPSSVKFRSVISWPIRGLGVWDAKLTETQIFRELSISIESSLIELKSSLIELNSSLIQLKSSLFQLGSSLIQLESSLYMYN